MSGIPEMDFWQGLILGLGARGSLARAAS